METPPRTWGRLRHSPVLWRSQRNTPTDVGKTLLAQRWDVGCQKHPHGRGEDQNLTFIYTVYIGNTPTDVGKTYTPSSSFAAGWKHPHGRGEDCGRLARTAISTETPPRTWGRHQQIVNERSQKHKMFGLFVFQGFDYKLQTTDSSHRLSGWAYAANFVTWRAGQGAENDNARLRRAMLV